MNVRLLVNLVDIYTDLQTQVCRAYVWRRNWHQIQWWTRGNRLLLYVVNDSHNNTTTTRNDKHPK